MTATEPLRIDRRDDGVVLLTLSRPAVRNAMTTELTAAWAEAMAGLVADTEARCVVVTGEGTAFSAGGDLSWLAESPDLAIGDLRERMTAFYRTWLAIREVPVPTVAAVNGPAVGAGLCLALACDLRYAAEGARFAAPFTRLGLHAGMAATWLLPEAVGVAAARELLLTGRMVGAQEAARLGLVSAVHPDGELLDRVLETAAGIAGTAPLAARLTKAALARGAHRSFEDALEWEALAQPVTMTTADLREGVAAQRERRSPRFTGR